MSKSIAGVIILFLFLLQPVVAQDNLIVSDISIKGNSTLSASQIKEQVAMYATGKIKRLLRKKAYLFNTQALKADSLRLVRYYQREGFLQVEIDRPVVLIAGDKKTVKVTFHVLEGQPVLVDTIVCNFQQNPADGLDSGEFLKQVDKKKILKKGRRFRDDDLIADRQFMIAELNKRGYAYAEVNYALSVVQEKSVNITWSIAPGPVCAFGQTRIIGNEKVAEKSIRKQVVFNDGQKFSSTLMNKSQKQIYDLGLFQIVTVKGISREGKNSDIPVMIRVREAPRWTTRFGIGYGIEDKFRFFTTVTKLGFLGGARRATLLLKHSALEPVNINLRLTQPGFITPRTSIILNPFYLRQAEPAYIATRLGGDVTLQQEIATKTNALITYTLEKVKQEETSERVTTSSVVDTSTLYNKSSITLGLNMDKSHPIFVPEKGFFAATTYKLSGLGLGSRFHFSKLQFDVRTYHKVVSQIIMAYRVKVGFLESYDDNGFVPVEERFFSGGSSSVRGWARSQLGPKNELGDPLGGNSLLEASAEARIPVWGLFSVVVFTDFGNVWEESYAHKITDLRYSLGTGLRISTPIGPIRLDLARPVFDQENQLQFHLSIGHAF
jgi:outer membrane protein insertion porin family